MNFKEAKETFENTRRRKLDNNTYLTKTEEGYGVRLHSTVIVEFLKDRVRLNSGGWKTLTTKDRMNSFSPSRIFQKDNIWFVGSKEVPYFDGIEISFHGRVLNGTKKKSQKIIKTQTSLLKKIDKYVAGFMKKIEEGKLDPPSIGDCWYCSMKTKEGKSLGEVTENNQHILDHIKEGYHVPSLLVNAIKEKGYNPSFMNPWNNQSRDTNIFKKSLRDFLKKRLLKGEA